MYINKKYYFQKGVKKISFCPYYTQYIFFFSIYLTSKANTAGKILSVVSLEPQLGV